MQVDYLIVGQGLAGSILARQFGARGRTVCVVDREDPSAASRVAAGLVNPVTGKKLVVTWRAETLLPYAGDFYREWERELGEEVFSPKTVWRFFQSEKEVERWEKKRHEPDFARFTAPLPDLSKVPHLWPQRGGFQIHGGFHVDTRRLLCLFRAHLRLRRLLVEETFSLADLEVEATGVRWRHIDARKIIFCEGHAASRNPYFNWIPFRHAKGELLTLRGASLPEDLVLNCGKWLLPVGGGLCRAGATYGWDDLSDQPTEAGREQILTAIRSLVGSELTVERHEAGVRPIVKDTRPVAGVHPAHPAVAIFNGLGSKGVLWGPYFGQQLVQHLENGHALDPVVDVRRNL
jgi:glycine/D-amino acid oxidase-like deaminating enzyme